MVPPLEILSYSSLALPERDSNHYASYLVNMLSYPVPRIPLNVRSCPLCWRQPMNADNKKDINSELDELDREEFYRLKKVNSWQFRFSFGKSR